MNLGKFPSLPPAGSATAKQGKDMSDLRSMPDKREALRQAAKEFESIFAYQMVSAMRKTVSSGEEGLINKGQGEKIFEGMLDEEWAKKMVSQNGSNSLGETIYRQMAMKLGWEDGILPQQGPFELGDSAQQWHEMQAQSPAMRALGDVKKLENDLGDVKKLENDLGDVKTDNDNDHDKDRP
jgi:Rod binding domain-containing protein